MPELPAFYYSRNKLSYLCIAAKLENVSLNNANCLFIETGKDGRKVCKIELTSDSTGLSPVNRQQKSRIRI